MFLSTPFLLPILLSASNSLEDIPNLDRRIDDIVSTQGLKARPIDKRIKLARCPQQVEIEYSSADALAVRCARLGWRIRVQLIGSANAIGTDKSTMRPAVFEIKKGEAVELQYAGSGFAVTSAAIAMENGRTGDAIRIKFPKSRTPMVARVVRRGVVEISN